MLKKLLKEVLRTTTPRLKRLQELGIETVEDFLLFFPRRYTDQREVVRTVDIKIGEVNTIRGTIRTFFHRGGWRGKMSITTALIEDKSGTVKAIWFNQPFLKQKIAKGMEVMLCGKAYLEPKSGNIIFKSPEVEAIKEQQIHTARIVPIYPETELDEQRKDVGKKSKLSSKWIREKLFSVMPAAKELVDFLPEQMRAAYDLMPYHEAVATAHFPADEAKLELAKHRLAFNELFLLQLAAMQRKSLWRKVAAKERKAIPANWNNIKLFTDKLPWKLTNAQKKAVYEIITDMAQQYPMSRLLEGETGSGKTVVAALAIYHAVSAGLQTCLLAPTEILARQHFATVTKLLEPFGITPQLLVGSQKPKEKDMIRALVASGQCTVIVGTHALLQEQVSFKNLGLAVVDEQHRFGVRQREKLKTYGSPHLLNMTATPIPRTLALVLYGDQELSILDELPPGRQKIVTRIVPEEKRSDAYGWITEHITSGRQAFIIFPLIDESETLELKAATKEFEKLSEEIFPQYRLGLLHGRLPPEEKDLTMQKFASGEVHILVSTSVVEVGVDVPNATIMMIEGAERFGLAQLHQFRGRVGRGSHESYCLLFPTFPSPENVKRLGALVKHDSGFKLAEIDLEIRGPGQVFGTQQSGMPDLRMATLSDAITIKQSREAAEKLIEEDSLLKKYPLLLEKIAEQENIAIDY